MDQNNQNLKDSPQTQLAAGHASNMEFAADNSKLIKTSNLLEMSAYQFISKMPEFDEIVPKVFNIVQIGHDKSKITMENLLYDVKDPIILDIKVGAWYHNEMDETYSTKYAEIPQELLKKTPESLTPLEKSENRMTKARKMAWRSTQSSIKLMNMAITGFKNEIVSKEFDSKMYTMDQEDFSKFFKQFFSEIQGSITHILEKLENIRKTLERSNFLEVKTPLHSSIFIVIDKECPDNAKVKYIDFGRTYDHGKIPKNVSIEQKNAILQAIDNIGTLVYRSISGK